jgi:micrococcal nuclease
VQHRCLTRRSSAVLAATVAASVLGATACGPFAAQSGGSFGSEIRTVVRVVDGDTIIVSPKERIRLIGVDAPESVAPNQAVECMGRESSRFLAELLPKGTEVRLGFDVEREDRYGRTLAYVWVTTTGVFVNAELVGRGFAQPLTIPPNIAHADEIADLARAARQADRGLWAACPVTSP